MVVFFNVQNGRMNVKKKKERKLLSSPFDRKMLKQQWMHYTITIAQEWQVTFSFIGSMIREIFQDYQIWEYNLFDTNLNKDVQVFKFIPRTNNEYQFKRNEKS